jgi:hypothetical protein
MSKIELNNEAWNRRLRFVDDAHNNGVEDQFFKSELDTSHIPTEYVRAWDDAQYGSQWSESCLPDITDVIINVRQVMFMHEYATDNHKSCEGTITNYYDDDCYWDMYEVDVAELHDTITNYLNS